MHCFNLILCAARKPLTSCVHLHREHVGSICCAASCDPSSVLRVEQRCQCVWFFFPPLPRRLPRDPPAADDGAVEVSPGEAGGAEGLLPAAQRHPGGALQEGCGEEHDSRASCAFIFPLGQMAA